MINKEINWNKDASIDPDALDIEWLNQSEIMLKYSHHLAFCEKQKDIAENELDLLKAEIEKDIRSNPATYKLEKVTESSVNAIILTNPEFKEKQQEFINAKFEWNTAKNAIKAIEHKKNALENLVELFGRSYFAGPKIPRNLAEEQKFAQEKHNSQMSERMTMRRKDRS